MDKYVSMYVCTVSERDHDHDPKITTMSSLPCTVSPRSRKDEVGMEARAGHFRWLGLHYFLLMAFIYKCIITEYCAVNNGLELYVSR